MLKCCSLFSGSSGNSFLVKSENATILIDAGVSLRKITTALLSFNIDISDIDGILISHEHIDHTKSIAAISLKYDIPIYANKETLSAFDSTKIPAKNINLFQVENSFYIKDILITPFSTPHDAASPCGFEISDNLSSLCIATDLGHVTPKIYKHFENCSFLMLESNYEPDILKISSYPYLLKQRISSDVGHLSNQSAAETIYKLAGGKLNQALLIHLSKENNIPEIALATIHEKLSTDPSLQKSLNVFVAPRDNPSTMFNVS